MAKVVSVTGPVARAVSVEEFQTHARIDGSDEELYLGDLLDAAEAEAEAYTWRKFVTQTWDQYFDSFSDPIVLQYPPVASVTTVKYLDFAGTEQTLAATYWELAVECGLSVVRLKYNQTWPVTYGHPDSVYIRTVCGYGVQSDSPKTIPAKIRQAIMMHAAWHYRNREGEGMPSAFKRYLSPYTVRRFVPVG